MWPAHTSLVINYVFTQPTDGTMCYNPPHPYSVFILHIVAQLSPITAPTAVYTHFLFPESRTHLHSAASQLLAVLHFKSGCLATQQAKKLCVGRHC